MKSVTASDLANDLNISTPRITQLAQLGVLVKSPDGGFDERASLLGYIGFLRKDQATVDSRNRQRDAQSMRQEVRYRREVRNLLTLQEVRTLAIGLFESLTTYAQAESQRTYDTLAQTMVAMDARVSVYEKVFNPLRQAALAWRDGVSAYIGALEQDMTAGDRIDAVVADLRRQIDAALVSDARPAKR